MKWPFRKGGNTQVDLLFVILFVSLLVSSVWLIFSLIELYQVTD